MTCQTGDAPLGIQRHVRRQPSPDRNADGMIEGPIGDVAAARCAGAVDVSRNLPRGGFMKCVCLRTGGRHMAGIAAQVEMMKLQTAVRTIPIVAKSVICSGLLQSHTV